MKARMTVHLRGQWNSDGDLRLWGTTPAGEPVAKIDLMLLLLARDEETWYGALAETWDEGPLGGVLLPASAVIRYFLDLPHNPLLDLSLSDELSMLKAAAEEAYAAAALLKLVPAMDEDGFGWELSHDAAPEDYPILSEQLSAGSNAPFRIWVNAWLQHAVARDASKQAAIARLERSQQWAESGQLASAEMTGEDWLRLSGWLSGKEPWLPAFRLAEPARAGGGPLASEAAWTLTYILLDRQQPSLMIECDATGAPVAELPAHWPASVHDSARMTLQSWLRAMPLLREPGADSRMRRTMDDRDAWTFLSEISPMISDLGAAVLLPAWWNKLGSVRPKLKAVLQAETSGEPAIFGMDQLISFEWKLAIGDIELTEEQFLALAEQQKPLHYVRGQWIVLDRELTGRIRKAMERSNRRKGLPLREVLRHQLGGNSSTANARETESDAMLDWEVEASGGLLRWMEQLRRAEGIPPVALSSNFAGALRPYQMDGLAWLVYLRKYGLGGILADDMGLGKTIQYIAYLLHVKEQEKPGNPSLLICPTSLIGNWQKEVERFAPSLKLHIHYGNHRDKRADTFEAAVQGCDLVLTSYMTALLDVQLLQRIRWDSICLDEAQNIKNAHTKQAAAVRKLTGRHRIAMTGTPIENRPSELWSIMDFANPGYFGSLSGFQRQYGQLSRSAEKQAAAQLRLLIRPFLLRRMKTDPRIVPDLPDKVESKVYVPLTPEQAAHYENVLEQLFADLDDRTGFDRRGRILAALTRLKQICGHPALFTKENGSAALAPRRSHKAMRLLEMVRELREDGDRCLIFTQYVEMGEMLKRMLEQACKEPVLFLHGGTNKTERDRLVEQFQSEAADSPGIFILSLKAGGTGLNLTQANHVFHYDRWWNPAVENQATDRAYRIGQRRLVQVHKFITLGTLEERIDQMIERKIGFSREIIDAGEGWLTELSTDALQELMELRQEWVSG